MRIWKQFSCLERTELLQYQKANEDTAAKNQSCAKEIKGYYPYFWLFVIGSVVGFFLEGFWSILRLRIWENHASTIWGPFCIVYGVGTVVIYAVGRRLAQKPKWLQFAVFAFVGTAVEFFSSLFQEAIFGSVSWDYSHHFLNVSGRVSLQMSLIWGALGILFTRWIFPHLEEVVHKMRGRRWNILCIVLSVFMVLNLLMTSVAVLRWRERLFDIPASNPLENYLDSAYGDERMEKIFCNMNFLE